MTMSVAVRVLLLVSLAFLLLAAFGCSSAEKSADTGDRVGVYDPRIVAIAFANSDGFRTELQSLRATRDAALASGDTDEVKRCEAEGQRRQEVLHGQAFEGASVDDILVQIKEALSVIMADTEVVRLEAKNAMSTASVTTVDVTDAIAAIFKPSAKTAKTIREMKAIPLK